MGKLDKAAGRRGPCDKPLARRTLFATMIVVFGGVVGGAPLPAHILDSQHDPSPIGYPGHGAPRNWQASPNHSHPHEKREVGSLQKLELKGKTMVVDTPVSEMPRNCAIGKRDLTKDAFPPPPSNLALHPDRSNRWGEKEDVPSVRTAYLSGLQQQPKSPADEMTFNPAPHPAVEGGDPWEKGKSHWTSPPTPKNGAARPADDFRLLLAAQF
ncbi:hypothetical protein NDA13_000599 [Ustilago tritici]|nr:hypothetical protein NDA13_000599 [Ustilago tritici]